MEAYFQNTSNLLFVPKMAVLRIEVLIRDLVMVSIIAFIRGLDRKISSTDL
jgi:hypothetical protein